MSIASQAACSCWPRCCCALPLLLPNPYYYDVAIRIAMNAVVVIGLNLLIGYTGQISLGHAGFFGHRRLRSAHPHDAVRLAAAAGAAGRLRGRRAAGVCDRAPDAQAQGPLPGHGHAGPGHHHLHRHHQRDAVHRRPRRHERAGARHRQPRTRGRQGLVRGDGAAAAAGELAGAEPDRLARGPRAAGHPRLGGGSAGGRRATRA